MNCIIPKVKEYLPIFLADIQRVKIPNNDGKDEYSYALSAKTYIGALIPRVEVIVGSFQHHMFPMDPTYHPKSDKTDFLSEV